MALIGYTLPYLVTNGLYSKIVGPRKQVLPYDIFFKQKTFLMWWFTFYESLAATEFIHDDTQSFKFNFKKTKYLEEYFLSTVNLEKVD